MERVQGALRERDERDATMEALADLQRESTARGATSNSSCRMNSLWPIWATRARAPGRDGGVDGRRAFTLGRADPEAPMSDDDKETLPAVLAVPGAHRPPEPGPEDILEIFAAAQLARSTGFRATLCRRLPRIGRARQRNDRVGAGRRTRWRGCRS